MLFNGFLIGALILMAVWAVFRVKSFRSDLTRPRFFHGFWLWFAALFLFFEFIPAWRCSKPLHSIVLIALFAGLLVDFFYYYGLKTPFVKKQIISAVWLLPVALFLTRPLWGSGQQVTMPWYGTARVWTDSVWQPEVWFFMDPETRDIAENKRIYDHPNYGKAVFAPISGQVLGWFEDDFLMLGSEDGNLELAIGPLMPDTVKLTPGSPVHEAQPIGLLSVIPDQIPGLQLRLLKGGPLRFKQVYAGRLMGFHYQSGILARNQLAAGNTEEKFKFSPAPRD